MSCGITDYCYTSLIETASLLVVEIGKSPSRVFFFSPLYMCRTHLSPGIMCCMQWSRLFTFRYISLFIASSVTVWILFMTVSLYREWGIILESHLSLVDTVHSMVGLYQDPLTHQNWWNLVAVLIIALLSATDMVLLSYVRRYQKEKIQTKRSATTLTAAALGMLGMGCAACGSLLLSVLLAYIGISASFLLVTYIGYGSLIFAILLLSYSVYRLYGHAKNPLVCPI